MNLSQMIANLKKAGDDGMIIDADKAVAQLGDAIQASGTPRAGSIITDAAETRAANQGRATAANYGRGFRRATRGDADGC